MRILAMIIVLMVTVLSPNNFCGAAEKDAAPVIELQNTIHRFGRVNEGEVVTHDFKVLNRGEVVLEIRQVEPG